MKKLKKKILIFDIDGVLLNSSHNMYLSWTKVQNKHSLENIAFNKYFKNIGKPFFNILSNLGINKNKKEIYFTYMKESIKQNNEVRFYSGITQSLKELKKNKFILCILTSKDSIRTKIFLKSYTKLFKLIMCQDLNTRGKPYPDKINKIIKILKVKKEDCVYIGDTNIDYKTAKNSKIDFIHARWGYGNRYNYKYFANKISDLKKILILNKN